MSQIEQLSSVKGKPMILHEGYIYTIERTTKTKSIFRCKNRDCKGKYALNINQIIQMKIIYQLSSMSYQFVHGRISLTLNIRSHCRAPQPVSVPSIQLKNEIKAHAAITDESTSTIIHSALRTYPLSAAGQLPKMNHLC
ncbi:unnamed protein product [Rotaria socialis]|uniref:FLYWCH-type domain-containing protein n=1 Tax=Rotaria socialis TaxID=392032 RepID=A0A821B9H3_9BILA|nr:unnamed protein product [Rotaria socialis]CAF4676505.1 unnamed protein product [Rotaria socialis]CAF4690247.1 unnamed protein product [Rotaria socialis]CAF4930313.1 unnamed protein product [Rotaria socialis]